MEGIMVKFKRKKGFVKDEAGNLFFQNEDGVKSDFYEAFLKMWDAPENKEWKERVSKQNALC